MATKKQGTAKDDGGKARKVKGTVALPDIDDPWGRLEAATRAFLYKAETHPEMAPSYTGTALILTYLPDPDFRAEVIKLVRRHIGASKGMHGLAYLQAERFAEAVHAALLADTLAEAATFVLRDLEASPLLWGRSGKLVGAGPKRPPHLGVATIKDALRDDYNREACADIRAECALALADEGDRDSWGAALARFRKDVSTVALAKKVLRGIEVDPRWVDDLYE